MRTHPFGADGPALGVVGQGTWYLDEARRADAIAALRAGLDHGLAHIDTAEMYGDGAAEELVGEAIAGRRDEVFLVSKVLPHNASRRGTIAACERSLQRLRTDRLDAYLLHWPGDHALEDTFAAFDELQRAGKILRWGVSNFDVPELEEALAIAGPGRIACNQVLYHLQERAVEHAVLPWCERHGVALVAYSPFGHDAFPAPDTTGGRVLADIAAARGASPRQPAPGRARLPHPQAFRAGHPQGRPRGACARQRRRARAGAVRHRDRAHRRGLPARREAALAADVVRA